MNKEEEISVKCPYDSEVHNFKRVVRRSATVGFAALKVPKRKETKTATRSFICPRTNREIVTKIK